MAVDLKTWKKDFFQKEKKSDTPSMIAQRFINVYRQLPILGEGAVPEFNRYLRSMGTPEVLIALKSLPGGVEVREYYDFLEEGEHQLGQTEAEAAEEQADETATAKLLPTAEEVSPLWDMMPMAYGYGGGEMTSGGAGALTPAKVFGLVTKISNAQVSLLETEYKKVLAKVIQNNQALLEMLSYLVIDSDIEKTQRNLKMLIDKVGQTQNVQMNEMAKAMTDSGAQISEKTKRTVASALEEFLLRQMDTAPKSEKGAN